MKKENKWLLINTSIVVVLSVLFILLYAFVLPTSNYDNVFGTKVTLSSEEVIEAVPNSNSYSIINKKVVATKGEKVVGDIYTLLIKNGYGQIEILMGIDTNGKVSVTPVLIDQSHIDIENMNGRITKQIKKDYKKISTDDLLNFVGELNVGTIESKASESTGTILSLLQRTIKHHLNIIDDIFEELFGEYEAVEDVSAISDFILSKLDVTFNESGETGSIYTLKKNGDYEGYNGTLNGDITLRVLVIDDIIKHIEIVDSKYEHTAGFQPAVKEYLDGWIDTKLSEYPNLDDVNLSTGSTGSTTLVDSMIRDLRDEIISGPFGGVFGSGYEVEVDDTFVKTTHVIEKSDVTVDGVVVGYIFTLKNGGVYQGSNEGNIEMIVAIKDGKIEDYKFTLYEHTTNIPAFQNNVLEFIADWIGTDLTLYPTLDAADLKTGSTNTTTMVDEMFRDLRDVLAGGGK